MISSCDKLEIEAGTPDCVKEKIADFDKSQSFCKDGGTSVTKHTFQNKTVYAFNPGNCGNDLEAEIIDAECNQLGFLGGIAGNTKINGEEFSNATFVSIVWED